MDLLKEYHKMHKSERRMSGVKWRAATINGFGKRISSFLSHIRDHIEYKRRERRIDAIIEALSAEMKRGDSPDLLPYQRELLRRMVRGEFICTRIPVRGRQYLPRKWE